MMRIRTETPYEVQSEQYREEAEAYIAHERLVEQARLAHKEHLQLDLLACFSRLENRSSEMLHAVERRIHGLIMWVLHWFVRPQIPPNGGTAL